MDIPLDDPEANRAAAKIQAGFRGHMTRKKMKPEDKTEGEERQEDRGQQEHICARTMTPWFDLDEEERQQGSRDGTMMAGAGWAGSQTHTFKSAPNEFFCFQHQLAVENEQFSRVNFVNFTTPLLLQHSCQQGCL